MDDNLCVKGFTYTFQCHLYKEIGINLNLLIVIKDKDS